MRMSIGGALAAVTLFAAPLTAAADPLTYPALKAMVAGMGFDAKEIGTATEPKFTIDVKAGTFNVPVGFEVSKSGRYIWTTANLGESKLSGDAAISALKRIGEIQPTSIWITAKGLLMIGIAIDNRDVTPAHLKFVTDKLGEDVGKTSDIWQSAPAPKTP